MASDEQFVKERFPKAYAIYSFSGKKIWIFSDIGKTLIGVGNTKEQAWTAAAERIRREDQDAK